MKRSVWCRFISAAQRFLNKKGATALRSPPHTMKHYYLMCSPGSPAYIFYAKIRTGNTHDQNSSLHEATGVILERIYSV